MIQKLKHQLEKLQKYKGFKADSYLCSAFIMADFKDLNSQNWQLDFYDTKKDKITSYITEPEVKIVNDETEAFKEEETKIEELKINNNLLEFKKILEISKNELNQLKETPNKTIVVLQTFNKKTTWNLSFVTNSFNLINLKIDAISGEILDNKKVELLNWNSQ